MQQWRPSLGCRKQRYNITDDINDIPRGRRYNSRQTGQNCYHLHAQNSFHFAQKWMESCRAGFVCQHPYIRRNSGYVRSRSFSCTRKVFKCLLHNKLKYSTRPAYTYNILRQRYIYCSKWADGIMIFSDIYLLSFVFISANWNALYSSLGRMPDTRALWVIVSLAR